MAIDLNTLSLAELVRIQKELPKVITKVKATEKAALRKEIEALAAKSGFDITEVFSSKTKARRPVKPKYRNPADTTQTWAGRGRKPKWVNALLQGGGSLDDVRI